MLDEGLPKNFARRDRMVADVYRRYLDVTLDEKAVKVVVAFGLTDRYTWLDEDQPREDGTHRRPLAFDRGCGRSRRTHAISNALRHAPNARPLLGAREGPLELPRGGGEGGLPDLDGRTGRADR